MTTLLPGTEVAARGLRWELVYTQSLGSQMLHRLRGIDGHFAGQEIDLLAPFDEITPVARNLRPEAPAPLPNWLAYPDAPRQCLAAFDELHSLGLEAFTKKHDPYWNIPLDDNLPQPVIDLPIPEAAPDAAPAKSHQELFEFETTAAPAGSGKLFTELPVAKKTRKRRV